MTSSNLPKLEMCDAWGSRWYSEESVHAREEWIITELLWIERHLKIFHEHELGIKLDNIILQLERKK